MAHEEPTLVERLIQEKAELHRQESELESFRRNIRLGDSPEIEPTVIPRLRRIFMRGAGLAGDGRRTQVSGAIVSEFYQFTHTKSAQLGDRLREIDAELKARSAS